MTSAPSSREVFLYSAHADDIQPKLSEYAVDVVAAPSAQRLLAMLHPQAPPAAVYIDDTTLDAGRIMSVVNAALTARVPHIIVGLFAQQTPLVMQLEQLSIPYLASPTPEAVVEAITVRMRAERRITSSATLIAVGSAKGGVGKSLIVANIAAAMTMRGARVLIIDGDMTNSGIVPLFRIPQGAPSYLLLRHEQRFTPEHVAQMIYRHEPSGIDFLLNADAGGPPIDDFVLSHWQAFMVAVQRLPEVRRDYDLILVDTGPDMKKRPYVLDVIKRGGWAIVPVHPGRNERQGAATAFYYISSTLGADALARTMALFVQSERGAAVRIEQVIPAVRSEFPSVHHLPIIPRDPRLVSLTSEADGYVSPLEVAPHGVFAARFHETCTRIAAITSLPLPKPEPSAPWWRRLMAQMNRRRLTIPASSGMMDPSGDSGAVGGAVS